MGSQKIEECYGFRCDKFWHLSLLKVAEQLIDTVEETAEIYSVTGAYDLLAKFHLANEQSFGEFVNFKLHTVPGIRDTFSLVAYRMFCVPNPDHDVMDETDFRKLAKRS